MDTSSLDNSISILENSISNSESRVSCLEWLLTGSTLVVVIGVAIEVLTLIKEHRDRHKDWRRGTIRSPEKPSRLLFAFEIVAAVMVTLGVSGELLIGVLYGHVNSDIRAKSRRLVGIVEKQTAEANERANTASLELAKLTAPTQEAPVINGVATPDLTKGFTQRVLLTSNARIAKPLLPNRIGNAAYSWTIFLDQDSKGGHLYKLDFAPEVLSAGMAPNARTAIEFVTDTAENTSVRGLPIIGQPATGEAAHKAIAK